MGYCGLLFWGLWMLGRQAWSLASGALLGVLAFGLGYTIMQQGPYEL